MTKKTGITDIANPPAGATEEQKIEHGDGDHSAQSNVVALASDIGLKA